jgi:glycosyltransferase 2 family protein
VRASVGRGLIASGDREPSRDRTPGAGELAIALATTAVTAIAASAPGVSRLEASLFRSVNALPTILEAPLTVVMQLGTLGAVPSSAGVAMLARRPGLAADLAAAGSLSWVAAKALKLLVARERPGLLLREVLSRGRKQRGLGFPSGHAAVAAALSMVAGPWVGSRTRYALYGLACTVGATRIYVGAHLPIDAAGGAALGASIAIVVMALHARAARSGSTRADFGDAYEARIAGEPSVGR